MDLDGEIETVRQHPARSETGFGTLEDAINFVKTKPKSTIGSADMEGLVCKPCVDIKDRQNRRVVVKVKAIDF